MAGDLQEGVIGRLVLGPYPLEAGAVRPAVGKVDPPEAGVVARLLEGGGIIGTSRPGRPGRLQFPRFAPIIAEL